MTNSCATSFGLARAENSPVSPGLDTAPRFDLGQRSFMSLSGTTINASLLAHVSVVVASVVSVSIRRAPRGA